MRQGQTYPSVSRAAGALAASLHSADGTPPLVAYTSGLTKSLGPHSHTDALRVVKPRPIVSVSAGRGLDGISVNSIINRAKEHLPSVDLLKEGEKQNYFRTNTQATISILLYEFASGTGEESRSFDERHAIVRSIMKLESTDLAVEDFYSENRGAFKHTAVPIQYGYQFSPTANPLTWRRAVLSHKGAIWSIVSSKDYLKFFLGGVVYHMKIEGNWINILVTDAKGRSSWYYHAGAVWNRARNVARNPKSPYNQLLTTTKQKYSFRIPLEEHRLFNWKQKLDHALEDYARGAERELRRIYKVYP